MRWLEYAVFLGTVIALARPVGLYVARVFEGKPTLLDPLLRPVERTLYRCSASARSEEMTAGVYLGCFLAFSALGTALLFLLLMLQRWLPGGPDDRYLTTPMTPDLAANTALSFSTTTTWQAYGGEIDPALPDPGRRAGVAELPRRGGRAGGGHRVHPRVRPRAVGDARQLLGRPGPGAALGPAAAVARGQPACWSGKGCRSTWPRTSWRGRSKGASR